MVLPIGKKTQDQNEVLSAQEAFSLWDILKSKYLQVDHLQIWENFAHDRDFKVILRQIVKTYRHNVGILEKELKRYSIMGPDQARSAINSPSNPEIVTDEHIAEDMFFYLQEHIENLMRAIRTSTTNDHVRSVLRDMLERTIAQEDAFLKYIRVKGWIDQPPLYKNSAGNTNERISGAEAYHLWEHLTFRYDNILQTRVLSLFIQDGDFKMVIETGVNELKKQIDILEKELNQFGMQLPKKPTDNLTFVRTEELCKDDHIYRTILIGLQGALTVHVAAIKQSTLNDRVRGIFKNLLFQEMEYVDRFIKYGKAKGWLNPEPLYRP
ncbi:MAG: spore coat protein [Bacillota bacterium]